MLVNAEKYVNKYACEVCGDKYANHSLDHNIYLWDLLDDEVL